MNKNKSYPRSRGKELKGISKELRTKTEENTRINNKKIKFFTFVDTKDTVLVRNLVRDLAKTRKK